MSNSITGHKWGVDQYCTMKIYRMCTEDEVRWKVSADNDESTEMIQLIFERRQCPFKIEYLETKYVIKKK